MHDYCYNTVRITGAPELLHQLYDAAKQGELFNSIIPLPSDLDITYGRVGEYNSPEQLDLERKQNNNNMKYGFPTWFQFCGEVWGTRYEVIEYHSIEFDKNVLCMSFYTEWSPPIGIYEQLTKLGLDVNATFDEYGIAFKGTYTSIDGMYSEEY